MRKLTVLAAVCAMLLLGAWAVIDLKPFPGGSGSGGTDVTEEPQIEPAEPAEPDHEEPEPEAQEPAFDLTDWQLLLVNEDNPLPVDYTVELGDIGSYQFDIRAIDALERMLADGNSQGLDLFIVSAYRSVEYQADLFERRIARWMATGMDRDGATEAAATSVAYPGTSEHNLGLAVDILCDTYTSLTSGFADTAAGTWLRENCAEYGFILRYPEDKTEVTGIIYEPWHFRYVGVEAARYITENGLCLEEFWVMFS